MAYSTNEDLQQLSPDDPEYRLAQKRIRKIKSFYTNLASWAGMSIFFLAFDIFLSGGVSWSKYPVFFWGISLVVQAFDVIRLQRLDKNWEDRQMRRFTGRGLKQEVPTSPPLEDYSDELLNQRDREMADLSEYRKVSKPWKEEDLV